MTEQVMKWIKQEALIEPGDCVIAGISGGADSVCLLLILLELRKTMDFNLCALHVEHGIRGEESRQDAAFVEALCGSRSVPCRVYAIDVPAYARSHGLGLEEAARIRRYECYGEEACRLREKAGSIKVALAHHADDNAETLLFQMARGSGLEGLAGMRPKRPLLPGAEIVRPLLRVLRSDIETYLSRAGQAYRTDSSNLDDSYSRNRIRHQVLPQLAKVNAQAVSHISQTARLLGQAADYLKKESADWAEKCCLWEEGSCLLQEHAFAECPGLLQSEIIHRILAELSGSGRDIGAVHVEAVRGLFSKQTGRSADLPHGVGARRVYGGVRIQKKDGGARKRLEGRSQKPEEGHKIGCQAGCQTGRQEGHKIGCQAGCQTEDKIEDKMEDKMEYEIKGPQRRRLEQGEEIFFELEDCQMAFRLLDFSGDSGQICKKKYTKWINYDKIKGDLQVRKPRRGDYLTIDLEGHQKRLKDYFVNEKIPLEQRGEIWLLTEGAHVIWVVGGRISSAYNIDAHTEKVLEVQIVGGIDYED